MLLTLAKFENTDEDHHGYGHNFCDCEEILQPRRQSNADAIGETDDHWKKWFCSIFTVEIEMKNLGGKMMDINEYTFW